MGLQMSFGFILEIPSFLRFFFILPRELLIDTAHIDLSRTPILLLQTHIYLSHTLSFMDRDHVHAVFSLSVLGTVPDT